MITCAEFWHELSSPFPPDIVDWRVGSTTKDKSKGMALAYIDARDVMERLDAVCGPAGWQCSYPHANAKTICEISIWAPRGGPMDNADDSEWGWVSKSDGSGDTDFEADKGAMSGAFKRAAVRFGIGRYLYNLSTPWMPIEGQGNSYRFTEEARKTLTKYLKDANPNFGTNQERVALRLLCKALDYMPHKEAILQFQADKRAEIGALTKANQEAFNNYITTKLAKMEKAA